METSTVKNPDWTSFAYAVIFCLIAPLLPLIFPITVNQRISSHELSIITALFAFANAAGTKHAILFLINICVGTIFSFQVGYEYSYDYFFVFSKEAFSISDDKLYGALFDDFRLKIIAALFTIHLLERASRHLVHQESFLPFIANK